MAEDFTKEGKDVWTLHRILKHRMISGHTGPNPQQSYIDLHRQRIWTVITNVLSKSEYCRGAFEISFLVKKIFKSYGTQ